MHDAETRRIASYEPEDISAGQLERNLAFLCIRYTISPTFEAKGYRGTYARSKLPAGFGQMLASRHYNVRTVYARQIQNNHIGVRCALKMGVAIAASAATTHHEFFRPLAEV